MKLFAVVLSALIAGMFCNAQAQPNCPSAGCVSPNLIYQVPAGTTNPSTAVLPFTRSLGFLVQLPMAGQTFLEQRLSLAQDCWHLISPTSL
mgnify:CR=1 FL=1